ncbi:hypothetical protein Slin14017_G126900 [Septoria linicola]|nr:hypothetical protein Slin14017_G126900 [Septoria linicola]
MAVEQQKRHIQTHEDPSRARDDLIIKLSSDALNDTNEADLERDKQRSEAEILELQEALKRCRSEPNAHAAIMKTIVHETVIRFLQDHRLAAPDQDEDIPDEDNLV